MHANDNTPTWLTAAELSARWNGTISVRTMANWRTSGCGPRYFKLGGRVLYKISDIEDFERARTVSNTSQYSRAG